MTITGTAEEVFIERMTWPEVRAAIDSGKTRALVLLGAMEQHGPHLPIGTDTFLGYELGDRLARALGDALVAPVITLGYSPGHLCYAGTVTLDERLVGQILLDSARSLAAHGFREIDIVPTHGGNYRAVGMVLADLRRELPAVRIVGFTSFDPWADWYREFAVARGIDPVRFGVHAAQSETSLMLASRFSDLVHRDRFTEGFLGDPSIRWRAPVPPPMDSMSPTGILGDARGATAELGNDLYEAKVAELVRRIQAGGDEASDSIR